jgi:hypothetical protein
MSGSQLLLLGGVPAAVPVDPYFYSVTSLLHGDGTNGGQNNTFLDSSTNNFTITRNGNTTQGSFSPFSQTGWSYAGSTSTAYLQVGSNAALQFGTGDFTIECWAYFTTVGTSGSGENVLLDFRPTSSSGAYPCFYLSNQTIVVEVASGIRITTSTIPLNQWIHIAWVRNSGNSKIYINGTQSGSTYADTNNYSCGSTNRIGNTAYFSTGDRTFNGYISNMRLVKGTAVYTSDFTPPVSPLTAITNTSLLTCQSNRFVDNSANAFAITVNSTPSIQPFSPFNPTTAYSTGSIGGSGYFDGSGDYLTAPDDAFWDLSAGTGSIELFVYPSAAPTNTPGLVGQCPTTANWGSYVYSDGRVAVGIQGTSELSAAAGSLIVAAWNHIVITRDNSTGRTRLFVNGVLKATGTGTYFNNSSAALHIGYFNNYAFNGYIADVRFCKGSIPTTYQTSSTTIDAAIFTPPSSPVTTSSQGATAADTELLLSYTNGAIFDNAAVADYETVGNAQISTSVKKYGTGSMSFDGTGDALLSPSSVLLSDFGTGDFTIEFWAYKANSTNNMALVGTRTGDASSTIRLSIYVSSTGYLECDIFNTANARMVSFAHSIPFAASTWYHCALVRVGSNFRLYFNGIQSSASGTSSDAIANSSLVMRVGNFSSSTLVDFNGYIDDLRITKGVARYLYNFTPPTAELPNIGGTITLTADPYYEYTTLLLPGNGTNGAQNNTFLDSSTNAFTITRNGNTTQGTFSPFSQTGWGNYFDGSGDYLSLADNAAFQYGTGDFTIEFWFYMSATAGSGNYYVLYDGRPSGTSGAYVNIAINNATPESYVSGSTVITGSALSANTWYHFAYARSGTSTKMFVNGTQVGSTYTDTTNYVNGTARPVIGTNGFSVGTSNFNGYFSNYRVVKGTAVYTANFTPPTSPLTAITNTSLLTCQSNRFIDNSSNAFAITRNGDTSVQAFSPFNPTAAWSAATYGGSGYFDGSGDYLTGPSNSAFDFGSGSFTVEFWAYKASSTNLMALIGTRTSDAASGIQWSMFVDNSGYLSTQIYNTSNAQIASFSHQTLFALNAWNHCALVRNGNTFYLYYNGVQSTSSASSSDAVANGSTVVRVGNFTTFANMNGYMSDVRILKGTAQYTASFTPPTAPLTAITNTQLLLNYTNGTIYDATSKNDLETVGNAQISTTQSKFGGSSMYFDGNGDYLYVAPAQNLPFLFGSGDFTVEGWIYPSGVSGTQYIASVWGIVGQSDTTFSSWVLRTNAANLEIVLQSGATTTVITGSGSGLATNTWQHVAVTRYGNTVKLFINGAQVVSSSYSSTLNSPASAFVVGLQLSNNNVFTGYIDDLRITKGIARYTSNFTPPTTAFLTL